MKIKKRTLKVINNTKIRLRLAMGLGFTEQWIIKSIEVNKGNGPLTTAKAMQIIREETGLNDDQILEEEKESIKA